MAEKKSIGLLLGLKPKPAEDAGESPRRLAAQGVLDAVKANDVEALEEALATFLDAGSDGPVEDESSSGLTA